MVIDVLTLEENSYSGFSHQVAITYQDLAALAAGNTGAFVIGNFIPQDIVLRVAVVLDTPFAFSDASIVSCTLGIADSVPNTWLTAEQVELAETPVLAVVAALTVSYTSGTSTVTATFTGTAAHNLNTATAGQVRILYSKNSLSKYSHY